jgi:FkbM family methyltransferase
MVGRVNRGLKASILRVRLGAKVRLVPVLVEDHVVEFAVEPDSSDPIARSLAERCFPSDAVNQFWRHLIRPEHNVIDVGAHLGTYSLPAAAAGAQVLSVEASPTNSMLLELAAKRNSFSNLHLLRAAAAAQVGTVEFTALGPWGHLALSGEQTGLKVAAVVLDDAIRARNWKRVDLIKIDVEGSELEALKGLEKLLGHDDAPPLLIEANGHMLHQYGHVPGDVLALLERHGYRCHQIDPGSDRRLVPVRSADLQPECVADYVAFKTTPEGLAPWWIDRPLERAEIILRVVATCRDSELIHRLYGARLLETAPQWLLEDEAVKEVKHILEDEAGAQLIPPRT